MGFVFPGCSEFCQLSQQYDCRDVCHNCETIWKDTIFWGQVPNLIRCSAFLNSDSWFRRQHMSSCSKSSPIRLLKRNRAIYVQEEGYNYILAYWRHQMEKLSALLAICAGNSPVTGEFPDKGQWHGALMLSLVCLNNRIGKQWWGWWFETPSWPLWRHRNFIN